MNSEQFVRNLLALLPYWHFKIDRPFKQLRKGDMSLETYYCLQMLRREGAMTMSDIARRLKFTKQQTTRIIARLIEYDFVERLYDKEDRRIIKIAITGRAVGYIEDNVARSLQYLEGQSKRLEPEELQELAEAMEVLLRVLPKLQ